MEHADLIIDARWLIPVEPAQALLEAHGIVVNAGNIVHIGPSSEIAARYAAESRVSLSEHVLVPGLVNLHTQAATSLLRGLADERPHGERLHNPLSAIESQTLSHAFVRDGTLLACAEMLQGGITCFSDMYFFPEAAAEAAVEAGMRASLGMVVLETPTPYAVDPHDYLAKGLAMRDDLRDEPLLTFCIAPHAASDSTLERVATYAAELDVPVHMRVHQSTGEIAESFAAHKARPLARLQRLGLLGPSFTAVHCVHFEPSEIDALCQHDCSVAHCPSANLRLGRGIAPVAAMLTRGVNVGLGTGSVTSNARLDVLGEMRAAALLAKGASGDPAAVPAHAALHMATLAGAKALGLDEHIGSLVPGKRADIAAIRLSDLALAPVYDALAHLVYAAGREHVSHVWVGGKLRVEDGALTGLDARELALKAAHWRDRIKA